MAHHVLTSVVGRRRLHTHHETPDPYQLCSGVRAERGPGQHAQVVMAATPKYTKVQPSIQISEVKQ